MELREATKVIGACDITVDALHLVHELESILSFTVLTQQAEVKKESFFEIWSQKDGLIKTLLGFGKVFLTAEIVQR